jgi:3-hydroxyacyl-CoA dehydrogenase/enoyl-CoA hydratase/3-hydroxybutyryl-CoA epimerase
MFKKRDGAIMSKGLLLMNDAGYKGRKNKRGFLAYDSKGKKRRGKFNPVVGKFFGNPRPKKFKAVEVQLRLSLLLLNEAVLCLQEGIIESVGDGDLGAIFGIGFRPFTGGPFRYIDQVGAASILKELDAHRNIFGERFRACDMLIEYAKSNKTFY